jgi:hypothetical protein
VSVVRDKAMQVASVETLLGRDADPWLTLADLRELVEHTAGWPADSTVSAVETPGSARIAVTRSLAVPE